MNMKLRLNPGDVILFAQSRGTLEPGQPPIRYRMSFVRFSESAEEESQKLWGKSWRYMVEGDECRALRKPFDIRHVQVSKKIYDQLGPVYLDPEDHSILEAGGYLETE